MLGSRVIVVRDGLIQDVLDGDQPIPEGTDVIDARSQTVLPGFVDSHTRFMAPPLPYTDDVERYGSGRLAAEEMSAFPGNRRHLLMNGVTGAIDMGSPVAGCVGLRKGLEKGSIVGPELYFAGPVLTAPGGNPARTAYVGNHDLIDQGTFQVKDTAAVRKEVASLAAQGVSFIQVVYDSTEGAPRLEPAVAQVAIQEAHKHGLKVFAQVGSEQEASAMARAGADGIEHCFATTSDSVLVEMKERSVTFIPAICARTHNEPAALPAMKQMLKQAWELDVRLCVGTDYPVSGGANCGDDVFREMQVWEDAGIPRLDVLRAATSVAAAKIGKDREIGAVAPGCRANLVFIEGAVDTGILSAGRISRVMLHGEAVIEDGKLSARYARQFKENSVTFFGYPYWDPLLSVLFGASATDFDLFHTGISATADVLFSIRNMWQANLALALPSPIPRTALRTVFHFDNLNRLYYGIGNDTELDDTTEYANVVFKEGVSGMTRITDEWKLSSGVLLDQSSLKQYKEWSLPETLTGREGGNEVAFSFALVHDTRDHDVNPWYGHYVSAGVQIAPRVLPGGHSFPKVSLDARGYVSPVHRHILAGRVVYQQTFGDVPFYYLPEFGGDTLGRGYMPYRFRDRVSVVGQFEYRFPIWSFISGAAFVDVGQFQPDLGGLTVKGFHPSLGFGPRFCFGSNESQMVGIDVGFTPEGWSLVLHNGQVF